MDYFKKNGLNQENNEPDLVDRLKSGFIKYVLVPSSFFSLNACGEKFKTIAEGEYFNSNYEIKLGEDKDVKLIKIVKVSKDQNNSNNNYRGPLHLDMPNFISGLLESSDKTTLYLKGNGIEFDDDNQPFLDLNSYRVIISRIDGKKYKNDSGHLADKAINEGLNPIGL
ncbi:MAG: hypothetical protein ACMXX8_03795, partial [Candidatus Woesearchaeota archaeon]